MNNRVDTTLPRSALLCLSAHTEALFHTWMQQVLDNLAISPSKLTEGQVAVLTLSAPERDNRLTHEPSIASTHQAARFPDTSCTLHWQAGRWVIVSLSSLTHLEEASPPCCEHAFWFGQKPVGYQLLWAPMRHEVAVMALHTWQQLLCAAPALVMQVSLELENQEHDITLCVSP